MLGKSRRLINVADGITAESWTGAGTLNDADKLHPPARMIVGWGLCAEPRRLELEDVAMGMADLNELTHLSIGDVCSDEVFWKLLIETCSWEVFDEDCWVVSV